MPCNEYDTACTSMHRHASCAPRSGVSWTRPYSATIARMAIAFLAQAWMLDANAEIFKYRDPETGGMILTNIRREPQAVTAPRPSPESGASILPALPPPPEPRLNPGPASSEFPRISARTQRHRDMDRRTILDEELRAEKSALDMAMSGGANAEKVERHRGNVEALEREIARLR